MDLDSNARLPSDGLLVRLIGHYVLTFAALAVALSCVCVPPEPVFVVIIFILSPPQDEFGLRKVQKNYALAKGNSPRGHGFSVFFF
jgi:hypothetical protein